MTKQITRWKPDTCDCVLEYSWDDIEPEDVRTHTIVNISKKCSFHSAFSTKEEIFNAVLDENRRKNFMYNEAVIQMSDAIDNNFSWHYDDAHVLHIDIPGITGSQRSTLQNVANNKFGVGKVKIK